MLNNSILEDIVLLENISKSIYDCYLKLHQIESKGKDSEEYKKIVENIKSIIIIEDSILMRIVQTNDCDAVLNFISEKYKKNAGINITVCQNYEDIIKTRISNNIYSAFLKESKSSFNNQVVANFYNDLIKLSLSIYERSNLFKDGNISRKIKYNAAFIFKNVENEFINQNFEVWEHPYITYKLFATDFGEMSKVSFLIDNECLRLLSVFANELSKTDINDKYNTELMCDKEFASCMFRAAFVIFNPMYSAKFKKSIEEFMYIIKDEKSLRPAYLLLNSSINNLTNDQEVPQYISFSR